MKRIFDLILSLWDGSKLTAVQNVVHRYVVHRCMQPNDNTDSTHPLSYLLGKTILCIQGPWMRAQFQLWSSAMAPNELATALRQKNEKITQLHEEKRVY